ncbi:uncharacterized protein [Dysidea avara]|uniref:uncharacterized protein isoform X1 n=1 Tax=Dysidea avara TaxID=196820 RepID=UPI003316F05A
MYLMCIDVHVLSVIKASEEYETIAEGMKGSLDKINSLLKDPHITINDEIYDVELFLCSDYKMILLLMGLKKASSQYACVWCKVDQKDRWDTGIEDTEYLVTNRRTLESLYEDYREKQYSCKHLPLVHIETDHIIPDELHLLLRITDILLKNFIATAVAHDKRLMKTRWKLKQGPMVRSVILNIRRCGIPFDIWMKKNDDESSDKSNYSYTSLVGYRKKNLLKFFPSKIPLCHPSTEVKRVAQLWIVSSKTIKLCVKGCNVCIIVEGFQRPLRFDIAKESAHSVRPTTPKGNRLLAKDWVDDYTDLRDVHCSYRPQYVTPYIHILTYHVPHLIRMYGNIKQFSCQAVEKKNDICKSIYFKSSNKWDAPKDIVDHEQRVKKLKAFARRKRGYTWHKKTASPESRQYQNL